MIDRSQPAKASGSRSWPDLLHRLDEDVLAQLLSLAVVAEPAQGDRHDVPLEALEQRRRRPAGRRAGRRGPGAISSVLSVSSVRVVMGALRVLRMKNANARTRRPMNRPGAGDRGNQGEQRTAAASGLFAENYREAARLASAVRLSGDQCAERHNAPLRPKISLNSLRPADAGTGTILPARAATKVAAAGHWTRCLPAFVCRQTADRRGMCPALRCWRGIEAQ